MSPTRIGVVIHTDLLTRLFSETDKAKLNALSEVRWTPSATPIDLAQALETLHDCEIGVGSWNTPYPNEALLSACPNLRLWEHGAGTVKHMFGDHLTGRNVQIASCKTAIADLVAEMVLGEITLGLRRVFENALANKTSIAKAPSHMKTLTGSTIGVVGASEVGKRVIRLLRYFPCNILLYDPYVTPAMAQELGVNLIKELPELCRKSDVVTLHTPDLPATRHIMNTECFQAMQDDTIFVNTARGNCVDEAALITELLEGRFFAFLDVSAPEPTPLDSPFRHLPNVVYTSHIAGPASFHIGRQIANDVEAYLQGGSPLCIVTPDTLDRIG